VVTININGLTLCHKGSGGISTATLPDVCKTPSPAGPVPIPYPNVAMSSDLANGTTTVKADGGNMCANYGSEFSRSTGDEPGTGGGVTSGKFIKEATWISYSFDVKLEGKGACRLTDKMFHNHQNTVNAAGEIQSSLAVEEKEIDCKAEWEEAEKQTKKIARETDPIKRNKVISAAYAKAYKETPHLQWFGAAAFASKQVGCGMVHARDVSNSSLPKITDRLGLTDDSKGLAERTVEKLGDGNKAVFEELQPAHEFYKKNGIEALKQCASERTPALPPRVVKGFELADQGMKTGNKALMQEGAETMLWQEQFVTLQKSAYDDLTFQKALAVNQKWSEGLLPTFGMAQPNRIVFDAGCSASGAPFLEMGGGNLGSPAWRWNFAKATVQKFSDLVATRPWIVNSSLDRIAAAGFP
jgi:hypothetical protein